jgi:aminoglycoside phosphotransferase
MIINQDIIDSIKSLPCFTEVRELSLLTSGMSHTCVKVITATQVYFAKKLNHGTASGEVNAAIACAEQDLSPRVIYYDKQWLVTKFVDGITLDKVQSCIDSKISIALKLMARCHHLTATDLNYSLPPLDTRQSVNALLINPLPLILNHRIILDEITRTLCTNIDSVICKIDNIDVLCHGDVNFTNILLEKDQSSWLIDFECAHRAPIEFDLGMFIAINDIPPIAQLNNVIDEYTSLVPAVSINVVLLTHYILYSFFINGLWYLDNGFCSLASRQWSAFDKFSLQQSINLPALMPLIGD